MYILNDYDKILNQIITNGLRKPTRTGIDTLSIYGAMGRYRIDEYFPLCTKRKAFYKSIVAELLWMLSGSTNINDLNKLGSKIWDFWRDADFEKRNGYEDGDLGPIYGNSFTNFGGDYKGNNGFNQVSYLIDELKNNKYSRRALINLWDPRVMTTDKVKLPTCHFCFQVLVDDQDRITGILTQRSGDWLPGISANILFYSAFLYMIGQQTGYKPYELVHNVADAHVYVNQLGAAREYLSRPEISSPKLVLKPAKDIFSYMVDDFVIEDYNPGETIKVPIAV
jgi:thymidylate synthase